MATAKKEKEAMKDRHQ